VAGPTRRRDQLTGADLALVEAVVTVTPTIQDGTVVRWRRSVHAAACISASRNRVSVDDDNFHTLPAAWITAAMQAHDQLTRDPNTNLSHLATHRHDGLSIVPLMLDDTAAQHADLAGKDGG
jgi:hypothetical protein